MTWVASPGRQKGAPGRSNAMPTPIEDPVLGRLTWDKVYGAWTWTFAVPLADGSAIRANMLPDAAWDPLNLDSLPRIRALVEWLRGNEPSLRARDRKSTRLNSSHMSISYAVFCLKKKTT